MRVVEVMEFRQPGHSLVYDWSAMTGYEVNYHKGLCGCGLGEPCCHTEVSRKFASFNDRGNGMRKEHARQMIADLILKVRSSTGVVEAVVPNVPEGVGYRVLENGNIEKVAVEVLLEGTGWHFGIGGFLTHPEYGSDLKVEVSFYYQGGSGLPSVF